VRFVASQDVELDWVVTMGDCYLQFLVEMVRESWQVILDEDQGRRQATLDDLDPETLDGLEQDSLDDHLDPFGEDR